MHSSASLHRLSIAPLGERLAEGRPVMTREQALQLSRQVMSTAAAETVVVTVTHTVRSVTQLASDRVRSTDQGETVTVGVRMTSGNGSNFVSFQTNQLDDRALRALVERAGAVVKGMIGWTEQVMPRQWDVQDTYPPAVLWQTSTADALRTAQEAVIPAVVNAARRQQLRASGFIGLLARAEAVLTKESVSGFSEETDSEVSVTARSADGTSTGWAGEAVRDWSSIDPTQIATRAADIAHRNQRPQALEPGRRTAILGPGAVVQLMRFFALHFNGGTSDYGLTGFSKVPNQIKGSRFNERLFDSRVKVTTDPTDPEGGFKPWFDKGYVSHPTTWIENGMLKYLAYGTKSLERGKPYAEMPWGFRLHGGETSIEQMIAQCDDGIYVNRFSNVDVLDMHTGMLTGVTSDGCFFVRHGKIDRPVKNFRFLASPFFLLNNLIALGPTRRAAYGYAPWTVTERQVASMPWRSEFYNWPRRPMVVPPMMIRDFNFSALVDAV
jgi:predicted Zn-dependent protease